LKLHVLHCRRRALCLVGIGACAAGCAVLFFLDPTSCHLYPPCLFHVVTGLYCPGCGSTRALHQLLHGNLVAAFRFNPLMVAALPLVCYCLLSQGAPAATGRAAAILRPKWNYAWAALWVILAYWVLRNIPIYPFTLLVPGGVAPWR